MGINQPDRGRQLGNFHHIHPTGTENFGAVTVSENCRLPPTKNDSPDSRP